MKKKLLSLSLGLSLIGLKAQYMDQRLEVGMPTGITKDYIVMQGGINWEFGWELNKTFGLGFGLFGHYNQANKIFKEYSGSSFLKDVAELDGGIYLCPRINFGDNNLMPYLSLNVGGVYAPIFNDLKDVKVSGFLEADKLKYNAFRDKLLAQAKTPNMGLWLQPTLGVQIYDFDISASYTSYFMKYPFYSLKIGYSYGHYHKLRKQIKSRKDLLQEMDREELERLRLEQSKPSKM